MGMFFQISTSSNEFYVCKLTQIIANKTKNTMNKLKYYVCFFTNDFILVTGFVWSVNNTSAKNIEQIINKEIPF